MRLKTVMVGTLTLYDRIVYKYTNSNYAIFLRDSQYSLHLCPTTHLLWRSNVYYVRPNLIMNEFSPQSAHWGTFPEFLRPNRTWNTTPTKLLCVHAKKNAEHTPSACKRRRAPIAIFQKKASLGYFVNFFVAHKIHLHVSYLAYSVLNFKSTAILGCLVQKVLVQVHRGVPGYTLVY